jgi:hypothetical protein
MDVFPTRLSMPEVLFFNNSCMLSAYLVGRPEAALFQDTALVVDVFHYKSKHTDDNVWCSTHCNPANFPELYDQERRRWTFNLSVCEQTNAWIRKYAGQLREMSAVRFEFFLDEVIKAKNEATVWELERRGPGPHLKPRSAL